MKKIHSTEKRGNWNCSGQVCANIHRPIPILARHRAPTAKDKVTISASVQRITVPNAYNNQRTKPTIS
jgi:hypothetical protein